MRFQYYLYYDPNSGLKKDNLDREKSKYFDFLCSCNFLSLVPHFLPTLIILFKLSMSTLEVNLRISICLCVHLRLATIYAEETKPAPLGQALPMSVLLCFSRLESSGRIDLLSVKHTSK